MKAVHHFEFLLAGALALALAACSNMQVTHVAPGQSARAALAARSAPAPSSSELPAPANAPTPDTGGGQTSAPPAQDALPALPVGAAGAPASSKVADQTGDSYTRGSFAMQAGQDEEAIQAFEETVKLDPDFTDAWGKLAILYKKNGDISKATEAFRKAKRLGDANGGTVTRDAAGGLQLR